MLYFEYILRGGSRMETLSLFQARLSSFGRVGRPSDVGLVYLAECFSDLFEESGKEAQFTGEPEDLRGVLYHLLKIASFLEVDVADAVGKKYPNCCSRCGQKPCTCWNLEKKQPYQSYLDPLLQELSLKGYQEMLGEIFLGWHTLAEEVQHVRNEIFELAQAVDRRDRSGIEEEIADVFARLIRVVNTLSISLDEERPLAS